MKKVLGKKNLKIIAASAMTIFSLFAVVTGAYSWFVSKMTFSQTGSNFGIYYDDSSITTLSCYAIKYDGVYGALATKLINGQDNDINMSEYDYILRDRNVNTPLFFRIEMTGFDENKDLQISIPCSGSYLANGQTYINNYLSNVVCAKFSHGLLIDDTLIPDTYVLTDNVIEGGDVKTIYEGMRDNMRSEEGTPFVKSSSQKDSTIQLTIDHSELYQSGNISQRDVDGDGNLDDIVVIYLAFDYYVTNTTNLVEDYILSYEGTEVEHSLSFQSDIGAMTLKDIEA